MGSSNKKKREKQKDFQKPKFKVGKAKAKASNFTDTSFKSKAIVMGQQSLSTAAPELHEQFTHNVSLASSKSDKQRREALAYLTSQLSSEPSFNPLGTGPLLTKLLPLISDSSTPVRSQLLKLFQALPPAQVRHSTEQIIMFVRAGMTHLSADISNDSLGCLEWLLDVAGDDLVECPGGWVKTLKSFCATAGWPLTSSQSGWSSSTKSKAGLKAKDAQHYSRQVTLLSQFLEIGLKPEACSTDSTSLDTPEALLKHVWHVSREPNAYAYLNLYGPPRDEDGEMYTSREARQQVFQRKFMTSVTTGVDEAKKQGGAVGRAAATLDQVLQERMSDLDEGMATNFYDLLDLW